MGNHFRVRGVLRELGWVERRISFVGMVKYQEGRERREDTERRDCDLFQNLPPTNENHRLWRWAFILLA